MRGFVVLCLLLCGAAVSGFTGCDPTDDAFAVTLLNDTRGTLIASQCGNGCGSRPTEKDRLKPGESIPVNTTSSHVDNWWRITSSTGRFAGCLNLLYDHKATRIVVRLSRLTACPTSSR